MSSRTTTARLLHVDCPRCGVALAVHVRGLDPGITDGEWLAHLDDGDRDHLHEAHDTAPIVSLPRARTRRMT